MVWSENVKLFFLGHIFFLIGCVSSALGISLPDLQCEFDTDLTDVSSVFLCFGCSGAVGSLVAIPCLERFNQYLLLCTAMIIECVTTATIAVWPHIHVAQALIVLVGFSCGILITGGQYMTCLLFPERTYVMLWLSAANAAGSLFAPVLAVPFLGKPTTETLNSSNSSSALALSDKSISGSFFNTTQNANGTHEHSTYCEDTESTIALLYVIIGAMGVPFAIAFGVYYFTDPRVNDCKPDDDQVSDGNKTREVVFIMLVVMILPESFGMPYALGSFLTTIGAETGQSDGITNMLLLASLFWLCILICRLIFIPVSYYVSHAVILWMSFLFSLIGLIVASLSSILGNVCLWVGSLLVAFSVSPQFGCLVTWARDHVRFRPVHCSVICVADYVGMTFLPYASGQLISSYGPYSLNYYCLALTVYGIILFSILTIVGRSVKNI